MVDSNKLPPKKYMYLWLPVKTFFHATILYAIMHTLIAGIILAIAFISEKNIDWGWHLIPNYNIYLWVLFLAIGLLDYRNRIKNLKENGKEINYGDN